MGIFNFLKKNKDQNTTIVDNDAEIDKELFVQEADDQEPAISTNIIIQRPVT